jgi:hypothetical protein
MSTIQELAKIIRENNAVASIQLSEVPPGDLYQMEGLKRDAMRKVAAAQKELSEVARQSLVGIFVNGAPEECKKWAEIAEDGGASFTVNAREIYERIFDRVMSSTPDRMELGVNQLSILLGEIQAIAIQCGARGLPSMNIGRMVGARYQTREEGIQHFYESIIFPFLGDELNVLYIQKKVTDELQKVDYQQNFVPVVVLNATKQEAEGELAAKLFWGANLSVDTEAPVDREQVSRAFKKLKGLLKNKGK